MDRYNIDEILAALRKRPELSPSQIALIAMLVLALLNAVLLAISIASFHRSRWISK